MLFGAMLSTRCIPAKVYNCFNSRRVYSFGKYGKALFLCCINSLLLLSISFYVTSVGFLYI